MNKIKSNFMEKSLQKRVFTLILFLFMGMNMIYAQQKSVTGTVVDESNAPLPGVTVMVKGTTIGTVANTDGFYSISVPGENATLVFSFIGMKTQEVVVGNETTVNLKMMPDAIGIGEVVAIGYGTQSRQAVTGSVTVADLETYRDIPVNNVLETVKGTIPGLIVGSTNSAGAQAGLMVRGQNSPTAGNSPLIVVDGVIYHGSLNDISPDDIISFTVLKDASAAAVYGSRSANGVILLKTKSGKGINGKARFNVKLTYGITNQLKPLELFDADGYIKRLIDINAYNGTTVTMDEVPNYMSQYERENYLATPNHKPTLKDPYSLIQQTGYNRKANISLSNSTEKSNYYISLSGIDQKGVVLNDKYQNFTARMNISSDVTDWFNLGIKTFYSFRDYSGSSPRMSYATILSPWAKIYEDDGTYTKFPNTTTSAPSPFWDIATVDVSLSNNLNGIISAVIKVPWIQGLSYNMNLSESMRWYERSYFYDDYTIVGQGVNGKGGRSYSKTNNMLIDNILRYKRIFADKHEVGVTALYSVEQSKWENMALSAEQFENMVLMDYKLENGTTQKVNTGGGESAGIGMMARATYTYDKRYSLTATIRRDGYSAFSRNKKWGNFSSFGFNWNVARESFMENVDAIDNLALRVSYGSTGNQAFGAYSTLAKVGTSKYVLAGQDGYNITQYISSLEASNLGWETTTGTNIGIDFAVLNNRISGSVEGYMTATTDLIFNRSLPTTSGYGRIKDNVGEIANRGIEVALHTVNIQKNDFQWSSDFAFSLNRNKVVSILGEDNDEDGVEDDLISSGYFMGRSLGTIYSSKILGIYQQEDVDNGTIMTGMRPGDYILEDISGADDEPDGKINSHDRQFLGVSKPNFRWSWTNSFKYKDFTLMAFIYSIWGGNDYFLGSVTPYNNAYSMRTDINTPAYDYWTPDNTGAEFPRLDYNKKAAFRGTRRYDRSFIKLQKLSLSYNMDRLVKPVGLNNMLLSVSADNLSVWAKEWPGLDPETGAGLNNNSRPSMRTILFSLSFNF